MPLEIDLIWNSSTFLDDSGCSSLFSQISQSSSEEVTAEGNKTFDLEKDKKIVAIERENAKLKFEIERLLQSEKWYKAQYKKYKVSKLDILEKYYSSEKNVSIKIKFMKDENTKLKEELVRNRSKPSSCDYDCKTFENNKILDCRKMQHTIDELQIVNDILRKQKDQLLTESNKVSANKDSRVLVDLTRKNKILIENLEKSNFEIDLLNIEIRRLKFERKMDLDQIFQLKKSWLDFQKKMGQEILDTKHSKIQLLKILLEHQTRHIHKTSEEEILVQQLSRKLKIIERTAMSQLSSKDFMIEKQAVEVSRLKDNMTVFQKSNIQLEEIIEKQKYLHYMQAQEFSEIYLAQKESIDDIEKHYDGEIEINLRNEKLSELVKSIKQRSQNLQTKYERFLHEIVLRKKASVCKNLEYKPADISIDYDEKVISSRFF